MELRLNLTDLRKLAKAEGISRELKIMLRGAYETVADEMYEHNVEYEQAIAYPVNVRIQNDLV